MTVYPPRGTTPWDDLLKDYVDDPTRLDEAVAARIDSTASAIAAALLRGFVAEEADRLDSSKEGLALNGTANDAAAFAAVVAKSATAYRPVALHGNARLATAQVLNSSVRLKGRPGAKITIAVSGIGIDIKPSGVAGGLVAAAAAGTNTITIPGAAWTVNEHVGKWAEVYDSAIAPLSGETTTHARRILSNTADTLTLEHAFGYAVPAGAALTFYTPLDEVDLSNLTIDRSVVGNGANIVIRYVRSVRLKKVTVEDSGNPATPAGNAISVYHCDKVRFIDCGVVRAGNFGMFLYNCDNVRIKNPTVTHWAGEFAIQLKDCRDGRITGGRFVADGSKGNNAISLKCSGLNPAYALSAKDCYATGTQQSAYEFSSITAEGSYFSAVDFKFIRCHADRCVHAGFGTVTDTGASPVGWTWRDSTAIRCGLGGFASAAANYLRVLDCDAILCGQEGVILGGDFCVVRGGLMQDNVQNYSGVGATLSSEIRLDATASGTIIEGVQFRRTAAGKAIRAVRELAGADKTLAKDCRIIEEVAAYNNDYNFSGASSKAIGRREVDSFTGSPTINEKPYHPLTATATLDFPSIAASGGTQDLTITVPGASVGDRADVVVPTTLNAGLTERAWVSATNTVTVRLTNATAGAIDPASGSYTAQVIKV